MQCRRRVVVFLVWIAHTPHTHTHTQAWPCWQSRERQGGILFSLSNGSDSCQSVSPAIGFWQFNIYAVNYESLTPAITEVTVDRCGRRRKGPFVSPVQNSAFPARNNGMMQNGIFTRELIKQEFTVEAQAQAHLRFSQRFLDFIKAESVFCSRETYRVRTV